VTIVRCVRSRESSSLTALSRMLSGVSVASRSSTTSAAAAPPSAVVSPDLAGASSSTFCIASASRSLDRLMNACRTVSTLCTDVF